MDLERKSEEDDLEVEKKNRGLRNTILQIVFYAFFLFCCIQIIPTYVIQRTEVSGPSMENTLKDKDQLIINKITYRISDPKRFDIIVFYPDKKNKAEYYVKRVIGLPGETVQIIGSDIYINGKVLKESYGKDPITYAGLAEEAIKLGKDEYFVLGDNRTLSLDSRYKEVGILKKSAIAGKTLIRIWPLSKFGTLK